MVSPERRMWMVRVSRRAEKAGPKDAWSNPTGQDYSVVDELKNMKKRLVQAERAHKELLARNQAEVRAARLQAQQAERKQTDLEGLVQQLVAENEQLRTGFAG